MRFVLNYRVESIWANHKLWKGAYNLHGDHLGDVLADLLRLQIAGFLGHLLGHLHKFIGLAFRSQNLREYI